MTVLYTFWNQFQQVKLFRQVISLVVQRQMFHLQDVWRQLEQRHVFLLQP